MTDHPDAALPDDALALLGDWPAPPRDDPAWEASRDAILARIAQPGPAVTDDVLAPPLPRAEGEPTGPADEGDQGLTALT